MGSFEGNSVFVTDGRWPVGKDTASHIQWLWRGSWHRQIFPLFALFRNTYSHTPRFPLLTVPSSSLCILDPHPLSNPTWKNVLHRSFCCLERLQCPSFPPCGAERARAQAFPSSKSCYVVLGLLGPPAPVLAAPLPSQHPCPEPPLSSTSPCRVPPSPVAYLLFTRGEVYFVIKGQR